MADLSVLLEFERGMIEAERPFDPSIRCDDEVRYYDLPALIASPDVEFAVAVLYEEVIGCGYARIETSKAFLRHKKHSYLGFMYVLPEHRGKGVNGWIINKLESWSAEKGVAEMRLEVYVDNAAAIRAYVANGYIGDILQMRKSVS